MSEENNKVSLKKTKTSIEKIAKDVYKKEFDSDTAIAIAVVVGFFVFLYIIGALTSR